MSGSLHRFVALVGDDEVTVELRLDGDGGARWRIGEREGVVTYRTAADGRAVTLRGERAVDEIAIRRDGDAFEATAGPHQVSGRLFAEGRYLVARMQGGLGGGDGVVTTGMPGRVVKVLVAEGDAVTAGQGLVILEAMKMENEVRAPRDGVVDRLGVAEGDAVEAGSTLLEIGDG